MKSYIDTLRKRKKDSHVYKKHQAVGLELAEILSDLNHKALYMKLAKTRDSGELMRVAKDVYQKDISKLPNNQLLNNPCIFGHSVIQL